MSEPLSVRAQKVQDALNRYGVRCEVVELPTDPAPGFGGILLGGIVARFGPDLPEDFHDEVLHLMYELEHGGRRERHRFADAPEGGAAVLLQDSQDAEVDVVQLEGAVVA